MNELIDWHRDQIKILTARRERYIERGGEFHYVLSGAIAVHQASINKIEEIKDRDE